MFAKDTAKKVSGFVEKSKNIVSVFQQTVNDLKEINAKAQAQHEDHQSTIEKLKAEQAQIQEVITGNEKVVNNILKIFE